MDDGHLEGDGVEDHDEENGDENVGAEEQSKQGDGGDAVAEEKENLNLNIKQFNSHVERCFCLFLLFVFVICLCNVMYQIVTA